MGSRPGVNVVGAKSSRKAGLGVRHVSCTRLSVWCRRPSARDLGTQTVKKGRATRGTGRESTDAGLAPSTSGRHLAREETPLQGGRGFLLVDEILLPGLMRDGRRHVEAPADHTLEPTATAGVAGYVADRYRTIDR